MSQRPELDKFGARKTVRPSPPADFPLYGLDASWTGARWLETFGEAVGDPVHWVSLGHQSLDGESLIYVETFSRQRIDARRARSVEAALPQVASYATALLANVTLPVQSLPRPDGFLRALIDQTQESSSQSEDWPPVRWHIDGGVVTARVWNFAGGWAAVSDALEAVYLAAVGVSNDPEGLSLAVLENGDAYHFDLGQPLHSSVMVASHTARIDGCPPPPQPRAWHADQLRLMR
jgi:hypothetical protein